MLRVSRTAIVLAVLLALAPQGRTEPYVRLWTLFTGQGRCLDVVNDPTRDKLVMANCGNFTGQQWTIAPTEDNEWASLGNAFSGPDLCLTAFVYGGLGWASMSACDGSPRQLWIIVPSPGEPEYLTLHSKLSGPGKCLDIRNDERDDTLMIAPCGNYSGQMWRMEPAD